MSKREDLTGKQFGRLEVVEWSHATDRHQYWLCKCECGTVKAVRADSLKDGAIQSCGCLKREQDEINLEQWRHGHASKDNQTREYLSWANMRSRCYNPNNKRYGRYGGRGIQVCSRWDDYEMFLEDMGKCPDGFTLNRIDNDGDYDPGNCEWASQKEQANNRRTNIVFHQDGKRKTLMMLCEEVGISYKTAIARYNAGWSLEESLGIEPHERVKNWRQSEVLLTIAGETKNLSAWSQETGIPVECLRQRVKHDWPEDKMLKPPRR